MKNSVFSFLFFTYLSFTAFAAKVNTVGNLQRRHEKKIKAMVITPDGYDGKKEFPVVYQLHGYGGNFTDWVKQYRLCLLPINIS